MSGLRDRAVDAGAARVEADVELFRGAGGRGGGGGVSGLRDRAVDVGAARVDADVELFRSAARRTAVAA